MADGASVTAERILIATGGHPTRPQQVEGAGIGIVSDDVFLLDERPGKLLIVGGGYIACEFAGIFNGMGSEVSQWHRGASILRGFDDEARGHLTELHVESGIDLHLGTDVLEMERQEDGIRVTGSSGRQGVFDEVLFATGRAPNTSGLGLEEAGVALGRKGQIKVDREVIEVARF
jgi:glutathione reductase (NADPH)